MLYELYQHLTTPCPRPIKDMGYLKEMIGMMARHQRCKAAWQPHLDQCRDWIVQAMGACERRTRVVVLGSGLLNDVPLDELSRGFDQVVLVDILHLPVVRKALKAYVNVELLETDISGFVDPLYQHIKVGGPLTLPQVPDFSFGGADLVISSNVVSQLPILPSEFSAKKDEPLDAQISTRLIASHLEALAGLASRVCLITETGQRLCQGGEVIEKNDPLYCVTIPESLKVQSATWDWNFAPHPERHPQYDLTYRVEGFFR